MYNNKKTIVTAQLVFSSEFEVGDWSLTWGIAFCMFWGLLRLLEEVLWGRFGDLYGLGLLQILVSVGHHFYEFQLCVKPLVHNSSWGWHLIGLRVLGALVRGIFWGDWGIFPGEGGGSGFM